MRFKLIYFARKLLFNATKKRFNRRSSSLQPLSRIKSKNQELKNQERRNLRLEIQEPENVKVKNI
jgi:hypothetical protein